MDQGYPLIGFTRALAGHLAPRWQFADQIEAATLSLRRVVEDLFVEPLDSTAIESFRPLSEEQQQEVFKECLDQDLEALIVIHD